MIRPYSIKGHWPLILGIGIAYTTLAGSSPITLQMFQGYDDGLFLRTALSLAEGQWLGAYDQFTLVKAPFYSIFVYLNSFTGLSLNISECILFFIAATYCSHVLVVFLLRRFAFAFYIILFSILLSPMLYIYRSRLLRDFFYESATLLVFAGFVVFCFAQRRSAGAVILGLALFVFSMTREETIWIAPLFILLAWRVLHDLTTLGRRAALTSTGLIVLMGVTFILAVEAYKSLNHRMYGARVAIEMTTDPFQSAMRELQRVGAMYDLPLVPVPRSARLAIYAASPSFATLMPHLEGPANQVTCSILPATCGDIAGGWFMWALRDAAAKAGHHRSAAAAGLFYATVASEVHAACSDGRLTCSTAMLPLIPHIPASQLRLVPGLLVKSLRLVSYLDGFRYAPTASVPHDSDRDVLALLNYPVIVGPDGTIQTSKTRQQLFEIWRSIVVGSAHALKWVLPFSLIVYLMCFVFDPKRLSNPVYMITFVIVLLAVSRIAILILVHISSFPAVYYPRFSLINLLISLAAAVALSQALVLIFERLGWARTAMLRGATPVGGLQ